MTECKCGNKFKVRNVQKAEGKAVVVKVECLTCGAIYSILTDLN